MAHHTKEAVSSNTMSKLPTKLSDEETAFITT
jgi:hypothetical protein